MINDITIDAKSFMNMNIDGALFSEDRVYRYLLARKLSYEKSTCLFIMLNPSTADETKNDPTVTRCINYARHWGFGRLKVCNIFPYRATDPKELYHHEYPHGVDHHWLNNDHIKQAIYHADRIVCAWGNHGTLQGRGLEVKQMVLDADKLPLVFNITQRGQPIHPLYQKADAELITWAA